MCTFYHYDIDDPQTYGSELNRLMAYEVREMVEGECDDEGDLIEQVEYSYADIGPAAGTPAEIRRTYSPELFGDVTLSSCLWYNQAGELWIVTQRSWWTDVEDPEVITEKIWEFRGSGRERYMIRERDVDWPDFEPIYDEAVWTGFDGGWAIV